MEATTAMLADTYIERSVSQYSANHDATPSISKATTSNTPTSQGATVIDPLTKPAKCVKYHKKTSEDSQGLVQLPLGAPCNGDPYFPRASISNPHDLSELPTPAEFQERFPQYRGGMVVPYGVRSNDVPEAIHALLANQLRPPRLVLSNNDFGACQTEKQALDTINEGFRPDVAGLYTHLCRSAAIMSTLLPRQKKESNEKYIQRLLDEADKTEAAVKKGSATTVEMKGRGKAAIPRRASNGQKREKKVQASSGLGAATVQEEQDDHDFTTQDVASRCCAHRDTVDALLAGDEENPIDLDHTNGSDYGNGEEDGIGHKSGESLEEGDFLLCPMCDWRIKEDKCMRCGYILGNNTEPGHSEGCNSERDRMNAMLDELLNGQ